MLYHWLHLRTNPFFLFTRLIPVLLIAASLAACTLTSTREPSSGLPDDFELADYQRYWVPQPGDKPAVVDLIKQADTLSSERAFEPAVDKLERLLRIEPTYALAWSRLSWIALQTFEPSRAMRMAQRSNSYAYNNTALKVINWSFIRDAASSLNNDAAVQRAQQMIEDLGGK